MSSFSPIIMAVRRNRLTLCLILTLILSTVSPLPLSAEEPQGTGTINVTIKPPADYVTVSWTLVQPSSKKRDLTSIETTFDEMEAGTYTLIATPPKGSTGKTKLTVNGELQKTMELPQISFTLNDGDSAEVEVNFTFTIIGDVGVGTDPSGMDFTLRGPNDIEIDGTTPQAFLDMPIGLYSVSLHEIEGCPQPAPQSDRLVEGKRVDFSFNLVCEALNELIEEEESSISDFISVKVSGVRVTFTDAPADSWYAGYVSEVAKNDILSGYKDENGNFTGKYGPSNNVTIAELLKIAHKVAGMGVDNVRRQPDNIRARNTWFAQYYASAEVQYWKITHDKREDPGRPATRGEVVSTLLQAFDVKRYWPKGELFTDVHPTHKYASSIETGAIHGIVSGKTDRNGAPTGEFGPDDPINRAEMAKVVSLAIKNYIEDSPEITGDNY